MEKALVRLLREPLFHFFAVGGLIFLLYANGVDRGGTSSNVIPISAAQIEQIAAQFSSVWNRIPTEDELDHVVDEYVREEVYYREALALGLDQNDAVVRQRLRQKMEFLTDISAQLLEPTADELQAYLTANDNKYRQGTRLAIEQIYLGQAPTPDDIAPLLTRLQAEPTMNSTALSEPTFLPAQLGLSLPEAIDSVYGDGFFDQIQDFSRGEWSGPVLSAYGTHLVRVVEIQHSQPPVMAEVRPAVLRAWQAEKAEELRELDYATRREHFVIEIYGREAQAKESP